MHLNNSMPQIPPTYSTNKSDLPARVLSLRLVGAVQGVGMRPFCKKMADQAGISGNIINRQGQVDIYAVGSRIALRQFIRQLRGFLQPGVRVQARLQRCAKGCIPLEYLDAAEFQILHADAEEGSYNKQVNVSLIPDRVPCEQCLVEFNEPSNRRFQYAFISCTDCGPRHSISDKTPFERDTTSYADWPMCADCEREYNNAGDRRYYAQTISCPACGPTFRLKSKDHPFTDADSPAICQQLVTTFDKDALAIVKSLSGLHILADAESPNAVAHLRELKQRANKPFALMFPSIEKVAEVCHVSAEERQLLLSASGPLVLLSLKASSYLASSIAPGLNRLAVMLPSTAFYHGLMAYWPKPLVVTSANIKDEPLMTNSSEIPDHWLQAVDIIVDHELTLVDGLDDSIMQIVDGKTMTIRPARGLIPMQFPFSATAAETIVGLGGWQKNTLATASDGRLLLGRYLGDLANAQTHLLREQRLASLLGNISEDQRSLVVADSHALMRNEPEMLGAPSICVQHHLAHALSIQAETTFSNTYMGIVWDGLGYPPVQVLEETSPYSSTLWGGEFFSISAAADTLPEHIGSFLPMHFAGGELAFEYPAVMAYSLLFQLTDAGLSAEIKAAADRLRVSSALSQQQWHWLHHQLAANQHVNLPTTSAVGRLFDAVAAIIGVAYENTYEAEAALRLQVAAESADNDCAVDLGSPVIDWQDGRTLVDWRPMISSLLMSLHLGPAECANGFIRWLSDVCCLVASMHGASNVSLSGGCFQNSLLLLMTAERFREQGVDVFWPQRVPLNDSGISVGQVIAGLRSAAHQRAN
ncbi:Carbamoyltransferase HypF [BD1-7 clade bacterium]|uniref:acylphosphatase n=1 Tax=BD1-7 clade bacterium TaxID=2029982 RepID=A0A5S9QLZ3_9GAMM|nr:Carbamoyltransferase HypF [BD1-7 clade bacterium]